MSEPPIDAQDLNDRTLGNSLLKAELLSLFVENGPTLLLNMRTAVEGGDLPSAAKTAHRLAGSAATVSAKGLTRQIRAIEQALDDGDAEWAQAALPAASDMLTACLRQVDRLRDQLK